MCLLRFWQKKEFLHYVGSREGYFETYEVSVLLDYLQILDNERQDLPLAAVLTSPFAGLDARELAKIRSTYPELFFYEAVHAYASDDEKEKDTNPAAKTEKLPLPGVGIPGYASIYSDA